LSEDDDNEREFRRRQEEEEELRRQEEEKEEGDASNGKVRRAKEAVLRLFLEGDVMVGYDRELRYRLEEDFPHDVVGKAVRQLMESRELRRTSLPGRRRMGGAINAFYCLPGSSYSRQFLDLMRKKLDLSVFITGVAPAMGTHAELAWWRAFVRNGWKVYPESESELGGVNSYKGRKCSVSNDIDFVARKGEVEYGVEVKNGLSYPDDLYWKFVVSIELGLIPLVIARWLNPGQVPLIEDLGGGKVVYKLGMYSTTYRSMVEQVREVLCSPIEARDEVDDSYFGRKVGAFHDLVLSDVDTRRRKLDEFGERVRGDARIRMTLGDKRG